MTPPTEWLDAWNAYNAFVDEQVGPGKEWDTIPHCDSRILHVQYMCEYCNRPEWTRKRLELGIAFTGTDLRDGWDIPCQADFERGDNHKFWRGNKPTSWTEHPEDWPEETVASQWMYGPHGQFDTEPGDD